MKWTRTLPAMVVAFAIGAQAWEEYPESVRELLAKPEPAYAKVSLRGGTNLHGGIARVTNRYLTFVEDREVGGCEQIELARIAEVKLDPYEKFGVGGEILSALFFAPLVLPGLIISWLHHDPLEGEWESVTPRDGKLHVLGFTGGSVSIGDETVREGRYRLDGDALVLDSEAGKERVPVEISCGDRLQVGSLRLESLPGYDSGPAADPIVGLWVRWGVSWDLRADGTFRIETRGREQAYRVRVSKDRIKLESGEKWEYRKAKDRLFITSGGGTTEYQPREPR